MTEIKFNTQTLCTKGEDLTPFYKISEAINAFGGKGVHAYRTADSGAVENIHIFENPIAHVAGNSFIIEESKIKKRGQFSGFISYLVIFDGYEITPDGVKLHSRNGFTLNIMKRSA